MMTERDDLLRQREAAFERMTGVLMEYQGDREDVTFVPPRVAMQLELLRRGIETIARRLVEAL